MIIDEQNIKIFPFNTIYSFNIIEGDELMPFPKGKPIELNFHSTISEDTFQINLFRDDVPEQDYIIYLDDLKINCEFSSHMKFCKVYASYFPQNKRFQTFNVYYADSQGNKKKSYLIPPIEITLDYIEKKPLNIEVSNLLTNCLTDHGYIVFDTTDKTLDNVVFSKAGFYLNVKKENSDSQTNKLYCYFHKSPGDSTKILCKEDDTLEEGIYILEEYISEGPIEDVSNRISKFYNIVIPNFYINEKFVYSSKGDHDREDIFDLLLREKIYLNYQDNEEFQNIFFDIDDYNSTNKYILGNSELESELYDDEIIRFKVPKSNFEKPGIYYIEKINALNEKERIYVLPPIEVSFSINNESKYLNIFSISILIIALLF